MRLQLVLLLTFGTGTALAQEPTPSRRSLTAPKAQLLIDQLDSKDYRDREKASKELAAEGDRALPYLKAALPKIESPEAQRRVEVLIHRLNSERVFRPSLVTVDCKNTPAKTVLKDLCKQAGYEYIHNGNGNPDKKITAKLTGVPFWEAMEAVGDSAGLTVVPQDDEKKSISAYTNDTYSPHHFVNGPFKFTATNINSSRGIQLANLPKRGQPTSPEYIGMSVQILAEPKLPIVGIGQVTLLKANDDTGASLLPPNNPEINEELRSVRFSVQNNYRSLSQSCGLNFNRGNREATTLKELHAKVALAILVEERPEITVENLLGAKKKKFAGVDLDLEIEDVTEAMGTVNLKVTFRQRDANPNDYNWSNTAMQRLVVLDDKGAKLVSNGVSEQSNGVGVVSMRMSFRPAPGKKAGKPSMLILNEWVTETREIEFKFKNIPLP